MAFSVSLINGMGTATVTGSEVVLAGANTSDFMHVASDFILSGGVTTQTAQGFYVQESSPAGMSVRVNPGTCYVPYASYTLNGGVNKFFRVESTATESLSIGANSSGSTRIDLICVAVDAVTDPNTEATNVGSALVVAGTPGAGIPATPNNHLVLAQVTVVNGASSIANAAIADVRNQVVLGNLAVPDGMLMNGKIDVAVATNNITARILALNGSTPSATNPVQAKINGKTYTITSALTVTKNAGTNWFDAGNTVQATFERDYFVYLGYNATDGVTLGFALIPYATTYSDFSVTTTDPRYCAISTITTAASTDPYVVVGRFAATLSGTASFNWSVPAYTPTNLIQRPIYQTRWLNTGSWLLASGGTAPTYTLEDLNRYMVDGSVVKLSKTSINTSGGTAGAGAVTLTCQLPIPMTTNQSSASRGDIPLGQLRYQNNTATSMGVVSKNAGVSNAIRFFVNTGTADTTPAAMTAAQQDQTTRMLAFTAEYRIN